MATVPPLGTFPLNGAEHALMVMLMRFAGLRIRTLLRARKSGTFFEGFGRVGTLCPRLTGWRWKNAPNRWKLVVTQNSGSVGRADITCLGRAIATHGPAEVFPRSRHRYLSYERKQLIYCWVEGDGGNAPGHDDGFGCHRLQAARAAAG